MKKFLSIVTLMLLVAVLSVAVSAVSVTYTIEETSNAGVYQLVATVSDETDGRFNMYTNNIHFDSNVITPTLKNGSTFDFSNANRAKASTVPYSWTELVWDDDLCEDVATTFKAEYTAAAYTIDGADSFLCFETYTKTDSVPGNADGKQVFGMYFKYVDGKTEDDLKACLSVDEVLYVTGEAQFVYGCAGKDDNFTITVPAAPAGDDEEEVAIENNDTVEEKGCPVFSVNFSTTIEAEEYGFIGTVRNENGVAEGDFNLDTDESKIVVATITAEEYEADKATRAWVTGIPAGTSVKVAVRAYYVVEGVVTYGGIMDYDFVG